MPVASDLPWLVYMLRLRRVRNLNAYPYIRIVVILSCFRLPFLGCLKFVFWVDAGGLQYFAKLFWTLCTEMSEAEELYS